MSQSSLQVHLVRHGETTLNAEGRFIGVTDVPLSEFGQSQAQRIAEALRQEPLSAIYSSPLQRARETAQAIATHQSAVPIVLPELAELHHGELEGQHYSVLAEKYPQLLASWIEDAGTAQMPGGDSVESLHQRVWPAFQELVAQSEGTVCLVSHKMTLSAILCATIGLPLRHAMRLEVGLATVSTLERRPRHGWRLIRLNAERL